jgi:hypothetical protein
MRARIVEIGGRSYEVFDRDVSALPRPLTGVTRKTSSLGPVDFFANIESRRLFVRMMVRPSLDIVWRELIEVVAEGPAK